MENRDNNQLKKSSSFKSEDIKDLKELIEIEKLSRLLEQFYNATGLANSILDLKGNILHGVGWKSICTEFHRKHKISLERCLLSDTILANRLKKKEKYSIYICQNGMVDVATPIIIDGVHVANLFIGQFFFETPDKGFFINQAQELGFDKEKYIKALEECHVYNKETILRYLDFFSGLVNMIGELALKAINQKKQVAEITNKEEQAIELIIAKEQVEAANAAISKAWKYNRSLIEASLDPIVIIGQDGILTDVNTAAENATGLLREKLIGTVFSEYVTEPGKAQAGYQQVFKDGKVFDYELNLKHISGYSIPVLYNASLYKDDEGQIIGVLAIARDISAIKKHENELIDFENNLESIVQQKTAELIIANKELAFQNEEKDKRAAELLIANKELAFQNEEKDKRAAELALANRELIFQTGEKADRAAELVIADKELAFQTGEKADRAAELLIADKELAFQTGEKADRAAELVIADKELAFQTGEKADRAAELVIADKELAFQTGEKADRAAELIIANRELRHQNEEKGKRAAELVIANKKLFIERKKTEELNNQLESRVTERTAQLESVNKELEAFSYSLSHDLKAPLRHITGYISLLVKKYIDLFPEEGLRYLDNISFSAVNMGELIDGLLQFSRTGRIEMNQKLLDMNEIVDALIQPYREQDQQHRLEFHINPLPPAFGDLEMIKSVWNNLIENAIKFSKKKDLAKISIGAEKNETGIIYYIKDNGAGFDMNYAAKLFTVFQRLHSREDYDGTGIGLATVQRMITRHGGKTWAEGKVGEGATFYFSLIKRRGSE